MFVNSNFFIEYYFRKQQYRPNMTPPPDASPMQKALNIIVDGDRNRARRTTEEI